MCLAYVHSVMDVQNNLFLRTNARVSRVIFEGDKAVGVAYVPSRNRAHQGQLLETIVSDGFSILVFTLIIVCDQVRARRCVVLSSGTLGTPQVEQLNTGNLLHDPHHSSADSRALWRRKCRALEEDGYKGRQRPSRCRVSHLYVAISSEHINTVYIANNTKITTRLCRVSYIFCDDGQGSNLDLQFTVYRRIASRWTISCVVTRRHAKRFVRAIFC